MLKGAASTVAAILLFASPSTTLGQSLTAKPGAVFRDCADCPEIVVVPPGSVLIGSTPEEAEREDLQPVNRTLEKPQHGVTIAKPFGVARLEVSKAEYAAFVRDTKRADGHGCMVWNPADATWAEKADKSWRDPGFTQADTEPVVCVNFDDATAYVKWMSDRTGKKYRLLSEAEWEYAARAGTTTTRPVGDGRETVCSQANVSDKTRAATHTILHDDPAKVFNCTDGAIYTAPVGKRAANAFGLHDMLGNAWEWVADCPTANYEGAPNDGSAVLAGDCSKRGYRGGSWYDPPRNVRSARRVWIDASEGASLRGFRIARTLD